MDQQSQQPTTIDAYIAQQSEEAQQKLTALRALVHEIVPDVRERICWRMPTFSLHGNIVHFAAFKKHIGMYPGASGVEQFQDRLVAYKTSKGAIQFPMGKPLPLDLIRDIVRFRADEDRGLEDIVFYDEE